ncbi:MAG: hypothetical protein KatS3mg114_1215 [Planctomycetaceae bacterium]|nr:MAG: hypothetical protein KatS3mg114_1215 [Planctomycetaceae bacterium]
MADSRHQQYWSLIAVALFLTIAGGSVCWYLGYAQESKPRGAREIPQPLRDFMRKKLGASHKILEGLTTEDESLVIAGADELLQISRAEQWRISQDVLYRQFSDEFQRHARQLRDAAEKQRFDEIALQWMATTMSCIECHKFVRGMRIASTR